MILVTGGTGLVGAHLLYTLSQEGCKLRALYRNEERLKVARKIFSYYSDDPDTYFNQIEWFRSDLLDLVSLHEAFDQVRQVYHTAAVVSFDPADRARIIQNNVDGTANIVNICLEKNVEKLCYVSSTSAIGPAPQGMLTDEGYIWSGGKQHTVYAVSKFNSEMEVWRGIAEGLNAVIVNPSIIIGPGDWTRSSAYLFLRIWKGMKYYTNGITGYVDIGDVITVMSRLMKGNSTAERYIVSSDNLSYKEFFTMVAGALGRNPPDRYASGFLMGLAWRLDWLRARILRNGRVLSKETVRTSSAQVRFSNRKVIEATGVTFKAIDQSIRDTAKIFLREMTAQTG
jgi:dihydroflavonol-4-reductase